MRDGGIAKDIPMVVNPRHLLSRLHREGLHGHSLPLPLHFPSGTRLAMNSDVLFSACPDYVDAARQVVR